MKLSAITLIETLEERFETYNHRKINPTLAATPDNLTHDKRSLGWYMRLTGSSAIFVGSERPPAEFKAGVMVKLSVEPYTEELAKKIEGTTCGKGAVGPAGLSGDKHLASTRDD